MKRSEDNTRMRAMQIAEALIRIMGLVSENTQGLMTMFGYVVLAIVNGVAKSKGIDEQVEIKKFAEYLQTISDDESRKAKKVDINAN